MSNGIIERLEARIEALEEEVSALKGTAHPGGTLAISNPRQRTRDEIVAKAKSDVEELMYLAGIGNSTPSTKISGSLTVKFQVNNDKRTVVALLFRKNIATTEVRWRGIAKCAPNDVFNAHIGKAIALRRALGLKVPTEYTNAPQPTEARVGDVVQVTSQGRITGTTMQLTKKCERYDSVGLGKAFYHTYDSGWLGDEQFDIIDDTVSTGGEA